jgi:competence protein ComEC
VYLAAAAGLAAGFGLPAGRTPLVATALALAAVAAWLARRCRMAGALAVAAAALVAARAADSADARCRARVMRGAEPVVVLEADARPGTSVRARALRPCATDLSLAVARGEAGAGAHVRVRGLAWPAGRRLRVPDATIEPADGSAALPALRARAGRTIDTLFGLDAPLVRALVVADARGIDAAVRDRYADAGLVHALSVSGLHVAIVAGALELLLRAVRVPAARAGIGAALVVAGYVALIGAPAPAVRAGMMLGASALARAVQRPTSPWAIFALGAGAPLVDPREIRELGYQLSVAGMAALVAGRQVVSRVRAFGRAPAPLRREPRYRRLARDLAAATRRGWRAHVAGELVVGTFAAVATAPLVACTSAG